VDGWTKSGAEARGDIPAVFSEEKPHGPAAGVEDRSNPVDETRQRPHAHGREDEVGILQRGGQRGGYRDGAGRAGRAVVAAGLAAPEGTAGSPVKA